MGGSHHTSRHESQQQECENGQYKNDFFTEAPQVRHRRLIPLSQSIIQDDFAT